MSIKLRNIGLILLGALAGVLISLNFQAIAERAARAPLPVEELRAFSEVFGAIKQNYVETVEDKKLITEAINGMLTGLDPHSAYLDAEAFKELQVGTRSRYRSRHGGRLRQSRFPDRGHTRVPRRHQAG